MGVNPVPRESGEGVVATDFRESELTVQGLRGHHSIEGKQSQQDVPEGSHKTVVKFFDSEDTIRWSMSWALLVWWCERIS